MRPVALLLAASLAITLVACKGSTTEPSTADYNSLTAKPILLTATGENAILEAQLLLDGDVIDDEDFTTTGAVGRVPFLASEDVPEGTHTLTVLLAKQTTNNPTDYTIPRFKISLMACGGGTFSDDGGSLRDIDMGTLTSSLVPGQSFTYTFYVPGCDPNER
jgi:hypothetical protein